MERDVAAGISAAAVGTGEMLGILRGADPARPVRLVWELAPDGAWVLGTDLGEPGRWRRYAGRGGAIMSLLADLADTGAATAT